MKIWKKLLLSLMILGLIMVPLAACDSNSNGDTTDPGSEETTEAPDADEPGDDTSYSIGIIQLVEHDALDLSREGFIDALADNGYIEGENVEYDYQNAQNDTSNLSTISQRFVNNNVDLVLAIATGAAQAIASETSEIPILGTSITDYESAKLVDSNEAPGGNVTGTSDMNPIQEQIELLMELAPETETIGIVYSSNEDNSVLQAGIAKEAAESLGLTVEEGTVTSTNEVQQVTTSVASKVDAMYIPTDNTYAASMAIVNEIAAEYGIPVICGEENMTLEGGLATLGVNYYDLGYQTGLMAVKVLKGEAEPAAMPVEYATGYAYTINADTVEALGITIPEKYAEYVVSPGA